MFFFKATLKIRVISGNLSKKSFLHFLAQLFLKSQRWARFQSQRRLNFSENFEAGAHLTAQRPVFQDPGSNFIETLAGQTAILPCFAIGTPAPMTR
jgi:hypothetical protein